MAIPAASFPALKAREVRRLLRRIGYETERQRGSHRKMVAPSRLPIGFAFHDSVEVPPRALRHMLVDRAGLNDEEVAELLWGRRRAGGRDLMHTVRVYENRDEGVRWWAEDDLGFTGGADDLLDLIDRIHAWAQCEGVLDKLEVQYVSALPEVPPPAPVPRIGL